MAKKPVGSGINSALLKRLADTTAAGGFLFLTQAEAESIGLGYNPPLIVVNTSMVDPQDSTKAAAKTTDAGNAYLANQGTVSATPAPVSQSPYAIITNAILPESKKRGGGGGAPVVYPFDQLQIGGTFFVPKSDKHKDPVKTLGSTVSSATMRYAEKTGEVAKMVTKRGPKNKAVLDSDGKKVKEMKNVPVYKHTRKFTIRAVEAGKSYGGWTAPADGALIGRVEVSA